MFSSTFKFVAKKGVGILRHGGYYNARVITKTTTRFFHHSVGAYQPKALSTFSRLQTQASIRKLAKISSFELDSAVIGASVVPAHASTQSADFSARLQGELSYTAAGIERIAGPMCPESVNAGGQFFFNNAILIAALQLNEGTCRYLPVRTLRGAARSRTDYHLTVQDVEVAFVGEAMEAITQGTVRKLLVPVLANMLEIRHTLTQQVSKRTGKTIEEAEELLRFMPSYGALTSGDNWVFCSYQWEGDRWAFRYTDTHKVVIPRGHQVIAGEKDVTRSAIKKSLAPVLTSLVNICMAQEDAVNELVLTLQRADVGK